MDWMTLLTPVISLFLTIMTGLALNWLRKFLREKYNIVLDDAQFEAAKKAVLNVEEQCLAGVKKGESACKGETKKAMAIDNLLSVRPELDLKDAGRQVDNAVAALPNVGALKEDVNKPAG